MKAIRFRGKPPPDHIDPSMIAARAIALLETGGLKAGTQAWTDPRLRHARQKARRRTRRGA